MGDEEFDEEAEDNVPVVAVVVVPMDDNMEEENNG